MPNEINHLNAAKNNQKAIDFLLPAIDDHAEWITTIAFYKALHLVEALFAKAKIQHGRTHEIRERFLKSNKKYSHIWKFYRNLWSASVVARYLQDNSQEYSSFLDYLSPEDVKNKVLGHWLKQIENSVQNLSKPTQ